MLVDRFLEGALEIDVDALCDGEDDVRRGGDAARRGGRRPLRRLVLRAAGAVARRASSVAAVEDASRASRRRSASIGLVNVQLALVDGTISGARGEPARVADGALRQQGDRRQSRRVGLPVAGRRNRWRHSRFRARRGASDVSVKAAVLPFARFPGSDPVLGPEMRSTGEVMATAADFPSAFGKAERAAGRPLPRSGTVFVSVRDADKRAIVSVAATLAGSASGSWRRRERPAPSQKRASTVETAAKVSETAGGDPTVVDLIRRGRCDLVINTPQESGAARSDGYLIREAALAARVPCVTTVAGAAACVQAVAHARADEHRQPPGAPCCDGELLSVTGRESLGPYTLLRVERGDLDPGRPGQFFMLEAPGRLLPRPMSLCLAPPDELAFLIEPLGRGTSALCGLEPGAAIHVLGPLGNGFDLDVSRPLLVGGGVGIAPLPYLSEALGHLRPCSASAAASRGGGDAATGR